VTYDVVVTTVTDRNDLFVQSMESLLAHVDVPPQGIIVNEDTRDHPDTAAGRGLVEAWLHAAQAAGRIKDFIHRQIPAGGMGPAVVWATEQAAIRMTSPFVLFTQEDWEFLRPTPVRACLSLMEVHGLHHVRFNKRKTMRAKHADTDHPWPKVQVDFGGQTCCISDHWYTQTSLWRVSVALAALRAATVHNPTAHGFVPTFNHIMNMTGYDGRDVMDPAFRHEKLKTYIWGPVGEPAFVRHLGSHRGTGPILHHLAEVQR